MNVYRVIDANLNRVSEGIRVLEDISRFVIENPKISKELRELRHHIRKSFCNDALIENRNAYNDLGFKISLDSILDKKESIEDLVAANFKRVQEGIRSIEECLKVIGYYKESKSYENLRFIAYNLEKYFFVHKCILDTDIYAITGESFSQGRTNIQVVRELLEAEIKVIQYREKNKSKIHKYNECLEIRRLTTEKKVIFIVNDDVDIALSVKSDGIHIGQEDMPVEQVRKIVGNMIIGVSTHNSDQAIKAVENGADYIGVGPIYPTSTKKNVEKSDGLSYLKWVSKNIKIPYVAIGGINESNILEVKKHGGKCFAMISEIVGARSIKDKVNTIRKIIK